MREQNYARAVRLYNVTSEAKAEEKESSKLPNKSLHQDGSVFTFLPASPPGATDSDSWRTVEALTKPGVDSQYERDLLNN